MLTDVQRRRIASARLDPPIAGRLGGTALVLMSAVSLSWTLAGDTIPSIVVIDRSLTVVAPMWVALVLVIRGQWEPIVAALGRHLEERESGREAPRSGISLRPLDVLVWAERRDLLATRNRGAKSRESVGVGWALLGVAGIAVVVNLWQLQKHQASGSVDFLLYVAGVAIGAVVAARARWRPIVAALRDELGESVIAAISQGREVATPGEGAPVPLSASSPDQQKAVARAEHESPLRSLAILGFVGVAFVLLHLATREAGGPTWTLEWVAPIVLAVVAAFEAGYLLARRRWRSIVAGLRDAGGPQFRAGANGDEDGG